MAIAIQSKYQVKDKVVVAIYEDTLKPYLRFETEIPGQLESLTDDALIQYALDDFYNRYMPNRAENEKFTNLDKQMAKMVESEAERYKEFEEIKEEFEDLKTENELMQETMQELILQIMVGGIVHEELTNTTDISIADETFNE